MSAQLIRTVQGVRDALARVRREGKLIGLVPTMGALHDGHGRLIETARKECASVVVSVFVNPIQFNRSDDYERYPRTLETDLRFAEQRGADLVFAPENAEMYPRTQRTHVEVEALADHLCGKFRPGHFRGVATVVTKLLNIVQPDRAYFGEKDAQQLAVIRRMVVDLNMPVEIVGVPIVREASGLALSSRNRHLSEEERRTATALYRSLRAAQAAVARGEADPDKVKREALAVLAEHPAIQVEYFEIVDPCEVQPVVEIRGPVLVAVAAWLGSTRLIDNVTATPQTA
ncbi:MAG TPA: pantoate--beta-alanine ligase [Bryobacteraceae bacterium]|nr:pantoate--beta-alanine ligase [Bryobacteraceae bacterium]